MNANLDGNAINAAFAQPNFDGSYPAGLGEYLNALGARRPVVLFAFAPKAAGTFLRSAAIDAIGGQLVRITHAQGGRDAQLYLPILIQYYMGGVCEGPLVAHVHMQALPANRHFLEILGIRPIIMLRSIPDMLASYWDMLMQSPQARAEGLNCLIPPDFADFPDAAKADFMIDIVAPWYVSYYATWLDYVAEAPGETCLLRYADMRSDPAAVLESALWHAGLPHTRDECRAALDIAWKGRSGLRFNRGVSGRGKTYFTSDHLDRLARMLSYHPVLAEYAAELL